MKLKAIVVVVVRRRRMHSEITSGQGEKKRSTKELQDTGIWYTTQHTITVNTNSSFYKYPYYIGYLHVILYRKCTPRLLAANNTSCNNGLDISENACVPITLPKCLKIYSKHFFLNPCACL